MITDQKEMRDKINSMIITKTEIADFIQVNPSTLSRFLQKKQTAGSGMLFKLNRFIEEREEKESFDNVN